MTILMRTTCKIGGTIYRKGQVYEVTDRIVRYMRISGFAEITEQPVTEQPEQKAFFTNGPEVKTIKDTNKPCNCKGKK